jgi:hypothetical protein
MVLDYQALLESYGNSWGAIKFMRANKAHYDTKQLDALEEDLARSN